MRLNKKFRTFKKGYLPGWTEEVFVVRKVLPVMTTTNKMEEFDDTPLQGTFTPGIYKNYNWTNPRILEWRKS